MNAQNFTISGIHKHLDQVVQDALARVGAEATVELAPPPDPEMGDLGFPCFALAKQLRKAPPLIAKEVAAAIGPDALIASVQTDKAYVNLRLRQEVLAASVLRQALEDAGRFGAAQVPEPQHWMVEYSSPNTNKPQHLGHMRTNLLGAAVAELLRFYGHRVTRVNLINDRGIHICKSMLAYQLWGESSEPEQRGLKGDQLVGQLYVQFERELAAEYARWQSSEAARKRHAEWLKTAAGKAALKQGNGDEAATQSTFFNDYKDDYFNNDSALGARARELLVRWEQGDAEVAALWRKMTDWVLAGFESTYERMGCGFDLMQFESQTYELGKALVAEGLAQGVLARRADGAVICDLSSVGLQGEKVLLRSDGTSVYMTQDLGTALERFDEHQAHELIYVVGDEQNFHFQVLFKILGLLRPGLEERCHHLGYGMIRLPEGKMKSREGKVVDADDLMDEMHRLARAETETRAEEGKAHTEGLSAAELRHRAERIGMAALKYFLLKYSPRTSFEYDPKASIDFLGQTGSYCLFNYARTRSLLRKVGGEPDFDAEAVARLQTPQEQQIIQQLFSWPEVVQRAALGLDPSRVAEFVFELCKSFAYIFTDKANHPIATCEDEQLRRGRLLLAAAVGNTVKAGLALLGIDVLEEM
jgi:arginyl-tRNA synthetase